MNSTDLAHSHDHHHETKNIKVAFFLNLVFTIIEIIGGLYTNSVAILADALHDLGDSLSLGLAWYFQKLSGKGRDKTYSYGYGRFSMLGALINAFVLLLGSVFIIRETIPRLINPEQADAKGMVFLAVLGILFNGAAFLKLRKGHSHNEEVVSLHILEDVLGWVAVLIGAIIMHFFDLPIIDPILSILISLFILYNVYHALKKSMGTFLQNIPKGLSEEKISSILIEHPGVRSVHDLHIWSMDGEHHVLTVHLVLESELNLSSQESLKKKIRHDLEKLNIQHATLELELQNADCGFEDC